MSQQTVYVPHVGVLLSPATKAPGTAVRDASDRDGSGAEQTGTSRSALGAAVACPPVADAMRRRERRWLRS